MSQYQFLACKEDELWFSLHFLELEPCDFLRIFLGFWPFEPHFLINFFLIQKSCMERF